jgi:hypothetical protein
MNVMRFIQDSITKSSIKREILKILPNRRRQRNIYYENKKFEVLTLYEIKQYKLNKFRYLLKIIILCAE